MRLHPAHEALYVRASAAPEAVEVLVNHALADGVEFPVGVVLVAGDLAEAASAGESTSRRSPKSRT